MSPLVTCLHKKHELQYSMYTSAGKYSHIFQLFFGKILINKMFKPRRKNYIYERNFIVKSSFHVGCTCPFSLGPPLSRRSVSFRITQETVQCINHFITGFSRSHSAKVMPLWPKSNQQFSMGGIHGNCWAKNTVHKWKKVIMHLLFVEPPLLR